MIRIRERGRRDIGVRPEEGYHADFINSRQYHVRFFFLN